MFALSSPEQMQRRRRLVAPRADAEAEEEAAIGAGIVAADLPGVVRAVAQSGAGIYSSVTKDPFGAKLVGRRAPFVDQAAQKRLAVGSRICMKKIEREREKER